MCELRDLLSEGKEVAAPARAPFYARWEHRKFDGAPNLENLWMESFHRLQFHTNFPRSREEMRWVLATATLPVIGWAAFTILNKVIDQFHGSPVG
jgi:hypothetical protein